MRGDPSRIQALRIAQAWGRSDVDAFLDDLTHEEYLELAAFEQLNPSGWTAMKIVATRLAYTIAQTQTAKKLDERDFQIALSSERVSSPRTESARMEAYAIRSQIAGGKMNHGQAD